MRRDSRDKKDDLVFVLRIRRSRKPGHYEFRFQNVAMSRKESLRNIRLFARFTDCVGVVVHDHRMLILEVPESRTIPILSSVIAFP
jgi:hypothetical protein